MKLKPLSYIQEMFESDSLEDNQSSQKKRRMFQAHTEMCGGYLDGGTKVAITIRLMSGGLSLDITARYCCGYTYANEVFRTILQR